MQNTYNEASLFLNKYQSYRNNFYIFGRNKRNTRLQQSCDSPVQGPFPIILKPNE